MPASGAAEPGSGGRRVVGQREVGAVFPRRQTRRGDRAHADGLRAAARDGQAARRGDHEGGRRTQRRRVDGRVPAGLGSPIVRMSPLGVMTWSDSTTVYRESPRPCSNAMARPTGPASVRTTREGYSRTPARTSVPVVPASRTTTTAQAMRAPRAEPPVVSRPPTPGVSGRSAARPGSSRCSRAADRSATVASRCGPTLGPAPRERPAPVPAPASARSGHQDRVHHVDDAVRLEDVGDGHA
jgi:hypothetical protein